MFQWVTVATLLYRTTAEYESVEFYRSSTSEDASDIVCTLGIKTDKITRGVSFDSQTGECQALSESWFNNPTQLPNSSYIRVYTREQVFEPSMDISIVIMPSFVVGSSFVYYVKTGSQPSTGRFWENTVKFNSYQGSWGYEISKTNPLVANTGYQFEVKYEAVAFELFINGSKFQEFQHRVSMSDCDVIRCNTDVGSCLRLVYFYPL